MRKHCRENHYLIKKMKLENIPGYYDLFGETKKSYEQLLSEIPSDLVINLLISLNNELYTNETESEKQIRLRQIIESRFTPWQTNINQFEFNERDNGPFGIAKVLAFCKYALANLRPYLRQYLFTNNFKSISQFIGSFSQILKENSTHNTGSLFRRLNHIRPLPGVDETHLKSQCINNLLGTQITIKDLRKFPLYQLANGSYKVIDETFYNNKLYRGPFFELIITPISSCTKSLIGIVQKSLKMF